MCSVFISRAVAKELDRDTSSKFDVVLSIFVSQMAPLRCLNWNAKMDCSLALSKKNSGCVAVHLLATVCHLD